VLAAVLKALDRAGFAAVATAMRECLTDPDDARLSTAEFEKLFLGSP
jgi:DNA-binding FrmR family transcriptional regulator